MELSSYDIIKKAPTRSNIVSRIAPTPSGYIHIGNILNFVLTWIKIKKNHGLLWLRIDDGDASRVRKHYVEHIFSTLEWLELDWDKGPEGPDEFFAKYSQQKKKDKYYYFLKSKIPQELLYTCTCSRKLIRKYTTNGIYPGWCYQLKKQIPFEMGKTNIRLHISGQEDVIVWRKDNFASFQFAGLIDDDEIEVNYILRGTDLKESASVQKYMARLMSLKNFKNCHIVYHPLIKDKLTGLKLSKSTGQLPLWPQGKVGLDKKDLKIKTIREVASYLLGLDHAAIKNLFNLQDLLEIDDLEEYYDRLVGE